MATMWFVAMSKVYKEYKSIRVPVEVHEMLEALCARQDMRYYKQNPEGTVSAAGRATMGGIVTMALELLRRQMDIEDGIVVKSDES